LAGQKNVFFVNVTEQSIMDWQLTANSNGHITCTQGGECLAGLTKACKEKIVSKSEIAILDATAHAIKFSEFQDLYFNSTIPSDYKIVSDTQKINLPALILPEDPDMVPSQRKRLNQKEFKIFVKDVSDKIAERLNLKLSS